MTAFGRVALAPCDLPVPDLPGELGQRVREDTIGLGERHRLVTVRLDGLEAALRSCPVPLSTMGREYDEDPAYFLAAAAAGRHAAALLAQ
jgi:hypothetical protein